MLGRYALPDMARVWSPEHKYEVWRQIELLALQAHARLGSVPEAEVREVAARSDFPIDGTFVDRVDEIENEVGHDVIAFVTAYAERVGEPGRYIHHGLTSYDVVDTALSVLMCEAADLLLSRIDQLTDAVAALAHQHRDTVMVGRTHGVHAEPITFGFKLAGWVCELKRDRDRLIAARRTVATGKLSGAVGTFAHLDPAVERFVCSELGLTPAPISTQILQRDRHAEFMCVLAVIAGTLDRFAVEIRSLQRTEVREVEEPFTERQKGSSAMPHKKNPIISERVSGLARVVRSNAAAALENMSLWHERDLSNSAPERLIIPSSCLLTDYMLAMMTRVMSGLRVFADRMLANLQASGGIVFSGRVLLALVERGLQREHAYRLVQTAAHEALESGGSFREAIGRSDEVTGCMTSEELDACFDYRPAIARVGEIMDRAGITVNEEEKE